ncbi:MAG: peptidase C45 [Gammaproteobacteria bacterium]|nr:peptidase C45 [Gammaproteobacteria bacterium]
MTALNQFPQITIDGEPYQRGRQHGEQLKTAIAETIIFYRSIFGLPDVEILHMAEYFRKLIQSFDASFIDEINGIAEGAEIDPLWIVALNARTEILSYKNALVSNECTSVYFPQQSIIGQNWDWGRALEPLTVLMKIVQPCGHTIRMITEPGIVGKIGMNSAGIGVCLNILTLGKKLGGLPVHIVLRGLLDCRSFSAARSLLEDYGDGKASNIIVADADGNGFDIEFCDDRVFMLKPERDYLLHTNHYIGDVINLKNNPDFASSYRRFDRAEFLLDRGIERSVTGMCGLLSDDSDSELPIYRDYVADDSVHELGTVCSIVMSLAEQKMFIRKGKGRDARFFEYGLD